jgi:hypothetical protein
MYWPVSTLALSVVYTRTNTTLTRLMTTPCSRASRLDPRSGQDQTSPFVQIMTDRIQRLRRATKVAGYHGNILTALRVPSHGQFYVVRQVGPSGENPASRA